MARHLKLEADTKPFDSRLFWCRVKPLEAEEASVPSLNLSYQHLSSNMWKEDDGVRCNLFQVKAFQSQNNFYLNGVKINVSVMTYEMLGPSTGCFPCSLLLHWWRAKKTQKQFHFKDQVCDHLFILLNHHQKQLLWMFSTLLGSSSNFKRVNWFVQ